MGKLPIAIFGLGQAERKCGCAENRASGEWKGFLKGLTGERKCLRPPARFRTEFEL